MQELGDGDYYRALHHPDAAEWRSVIEAFEDIGRVAAECDVPVLVVVFPVLYGAPWDEYRYRDLHAQVARLAESNGMSVVDLLDTDAAHPHRALRVEPGNHHPNALGHRLAAEAVQTWIEEHAAELRR